MAVIHSDAPPVHRPWRRNLGFGIGSVALLAGTLWMVWFDYHREWKGYQRRFRSMEVERAGQKLAAEKSRLDASAELRGLEDQREAAKQEMAGRESELETAREELADTERRFYVAEQDWKIEKSYYDAEKYEYEEERRHLEESGGSEEDLKSAREKFEGYEKRFLEAVTGLEEAAQTRNAAQAKVRALTGKVEELGKKIARLTEQEDLLQRKIEANTPTLTTFIRDAPVLDMAAPTLKVEQVILPNLMTDINFMTIPRVDRCVTCHKGIMDPAYADAEQPFRTHPRLDLFLGDNSAHPYNRTGCTVCHQGLDRATSFASAMHTPRSREQAEEWEERYHWHAPHYWDFPQLPAQHAQASCRTCHLQEVRVKGADRYNRGLDLLEKAGCYGCHRIAGYETQRKAGPDLRRIGAKVRPDWAWRWIEDPRSYRPTTWMPRFFHLTNSSSPEDRARSAAEIEAIVAYLFAKSKPWTPAAAPVPAGDPARGRRLVSEKGCLGCHQIGEKPAARGTFGRDFGPALDRVGDKVTAEWLFDWIRNPRRYFPETNMPDLRLTDGEAADVTAYLMTLRGAPPQPPPATDAPLLEALTTEYLRDRLTGAQAAAKAASMSPQEKKVYLGEKLISRYGCFGCHHIEGFEQALPIGVELTTEGTKLITRLDFGFVDIPHDKPSWFYQKLKDPRIFDNGKVKTPQEKLKMPDFGFTDEEAETLVTLLLSMQKDIQPMASHRILDERGAAAEKGRRLVQDRNCRGCHIVEGEGGAIRQVIADQAFYPPNLIGEGQKVQSDWLYEFLKGPGTVRPWLTVKMPTFHFTSDEAATLTKYFAALDEAPYPFHAEVAAAADPDKLRAGQKTFQDFKCLSCHTVGTLPPGVSLADLAPDLTMARERLRHDWVVKWLRDPQKLLPGTRMPAFFFIDGQPMYPDAAARMEAVSDYVLTLGSSRRAGALPGTSPSGM